MEILYPCSLTVLLILESFLKYLCPNNIMAKLAFFKGSQVKTFLNAFLITILDILKY